MLNEKALCKLKNLKAEEAQLQDYIEEGHNIDIISCCKRLLVLQAGISKIEAALSIDSCSEDLLNSIA